jgi:hypothetical protein
LREQEARRIRENERKRIWAAKKRAALRQAPVKKPVKSAQAERYKKEDEMLDEHDVRLHRTKPTVSSPKLYTKEEVKRLILEFAKQQQEPQPAPVLTRQERKKQTRREKLESQLRRMTDAPEEAKYPVSTDEARRILEEDGKRLVERLQEPQTSHFKGKKPIQFAKEAEPEEEPEEPPRQVIQQPRRRIRFSRRGAPAPERQNIPDVIGEQIERKPYQTAFCPEAILDVKEIRRRPEEHLEINIIKKSRVVDVFCIPVDKKKFHYKTVLYDVIEEGIYLMPTKSGLLMPSSYYREGTVKPALFLNTNKGITGRALSLLYREQLYRQILYAEDPKYNLFIVILLIAILICYGIGAYFVFFHNGGMFPVPDLPLIGGG